MNRSPLISVLIPAYYSEKTLRAAIKSALEQDYAPLELIVSDDGTPGFDAAEIKRVAAHFNAATPCTVLSHRENRGTVANLNAALSRASGEWIQPLAADDTFASPQSVKLLLETALAKDSPWVLARTALCGASMEATGRYVPTGAELELLRRGDIRALYFRVCQGSILPAGGLLRKELLDRLGGFDPQYRLVEDWPLALKLLRMGILPAISESVCMYHRDGGVSWKASGSNQAYQKDLIAVMTREILPHLDGLDERERRLVQHRIADKQAVYWLRFACGSPAEKLAWFARHMDVVLRKAKERFTRNDR